MKRLISLVLIASVFVFSMAVPSYAAEPNYIDVLKYSIVNDSSSNSIGYTNNIELFWDMPYVSNFYELEFIFQSLKPLDYFRFDNGQFVSNLSITELGNGYYRAYGSMSGNSWNRLIFKVQSSGYNVLNFLSFKVFLTPTQYFDTQVVGYGSAVTFNDIDIGYNVSGKQNSFSWTWGTSLIDERNFSSYYKIMDWRNYDLVSLQLIYIVQGISSISVTYGDMNVPFTINEIESDFGGMPARLLTIDIDVSSLISSTGDELEIQIFGSPFLGDYVNSVGIIGSCGILYTSHLSDISIWFSKLENWFVNLQNSITSSIAQWGQKIIDAVNPDTDAADSIIDKTQDQANQMDDVNSQMQQLPKPDLSGSGDTSNIVSVADTQKYTVFLARVVQAPFIADVIMISLIMSLAGYVLFGKR